MYKYILYRHLYINMTMHVSVIFDNKFDDRLNYSNNALYNNDNRNKFATKKNTF